MNKSDTLEALHKAKESHLKQMDKIELLLEKKNISSPTPLAKTECDFGKIFYGKNENFHYILGAQFYEKLDSLHEEWHMQYIKINNIFFKEKRQGFFSKIVKGDKINPLEYDRARMYYVELNEITQELIKMLDASLRRVEALSASKFKS